MKALVVRRRRGGLRQVPWLLVLPALAFALAMHYVAPLAGAWYAFTDWNGLTEARWIGLDNFRQIFSDATTRGALKNTFVLAACFWVLTNATGMMLALALNRVLKSRHFLRAIFFLPAVMSPLAIGYVWRFVFSFDGPLNQLFGAVGLESWQTPWLADPNWALWTILVLLVWQFSGLAMILYLAGLQAIPDELYEAATIDGASAWMRFRRITFPLLAPAFTVASSLLLIFGLRVFDQVLAMTGGGPVDATETLATQVWEQTWVNGRFGFGAALAVILTAIVAVITITQAVVLRRREARV